MPVSRLSAFISATLADQEQQWSSSGLARIAGFAVPDVVMGVRENLLRSDAYSLWARWFMEAICDPQRFTETKFKYADIVSEVLIRSSSMFAHVPYDERNTIGRELARLINAEVERRRNRERNQPSPEIKKFLIEVSSPVPHCWICGYRFGEETIAKFLRLGSARPPLPQFVDYLKPHGLNDRDLGIEVDHVLPVVEGGGDDDNLRLACGWCNGAKGGHTFIYDVAAKPLVATHPTLREVTLPRRFWVVRTLAIRQRCEHSDCNKTVKDDQLTIKPMHPVGAMNPTNLLITCTEHDPIASVRLVSRETAKNMWKKGASE